MENKKKTIFNVIFCWWYLPVQCMAYFMGEDIGEDCEDPGTGQCIMADSGSDLCCGFIWGESIIIYYMMRTLKIRLKNGHVFCFHRLDSSSAVSHLRHLEDSRHRFII